MKTENKQYGTIHEKTEMAAYHPNLRKAESVWETVCMGYTARIWGVLADGGSHCTSEKFFPSWETARAWLLSRGASLNI